MKLIKLALAATTLALAAPVAIAQDAATETAAAPASSRVVYSPTRVITSNKTIRFSRNV